MVSTKPALVLPGPKVLKHIVFVRFNDGITDEQIEKLIKDYANVAGVIEPVKGFGWGKNYPVQQLNHDYQYGFELSFESEDAFKEYLQSPALAEFHDKFLPACASRMVMDYYLF
ncbi:hypothetical protein DKX38_015944 [Salix brachista]|uniref:Stress-response A/B barrel domain-containing protein n=1 Tax=Salix brachista TaxID=2182728 RepID=A0A5N5L8N4_9ROSI|nr:hypothetical protein DKX38_015944 [Salix brachista]